MFRHISNMNFHLTLNPEKSNDKTSGKTESKLLFLAILGILCPFLGNNFFETLSSISV